MATEFKNAEYYRNRLNTIALEESVQDAENALRSEAKVNELLVACYEKIEKASTGFAECVLPKEYWDLGYYYDENTDFLQGVLDRVIKQLKDNDFKVEQTEKSLEISF